MEVEAGDALETDEIENTVDYGVAFAVIEKIVVGQRRYLIEALANDICRRCASVIRKSSGCE